VSAVVSESAEESVVYAPAAILIANSRHICSKIRHVSDIVSNFRDHCRRLDLFLINFRRLLIKYRYGSLILVRTKDPISISRCKFEKIVALGAK
jgi:hypothetical protein